MPLFYDSQTSFILYKEKKAGEYKIEDGVARVTLALTFACDSHEWGIPFSGLLEGLSHVKKTHPRNKTLPFIVETAIRFEPKSATDSKLRGGQLTFSIMYECDPDEWVVPLSYLHNSLLSLKTNHPEEKTVVLTIDTDESDIAETDHNAILLLTEKEIKQDGFKWRFHKNDPDKWPSDLHGHDYERKLKIDAYTGYIYVMSTRQLWKKLKPKKLAYIQNTLRQSSDFCNKLQRLSNVNAPI